MPRFEQVRHPPPSPLHTPRELVVACAPLRSNVNLSRIVRVAGNCGVGRLVCCGRQRVVSKIARDAESGLEVDVHRTLAYPLRELREQGYQLIGLEQTTGSQNLHTFQFLRRTVLVIGNERHGIEPDVLELLDAVVEIPVFGLPHSYNVATAASMALYEFCRQYPQG